MWGEVSGISGGGFRWYLRGRTCSPFLPSTRSIAGVLMGREKRAVKKQRSGTARRKTRSPLPVVLSGFVERAGDAHTEETPADTRDAQRYEEQDKGQDEEEDDEQSRSDRVGL